MVLAQRKLISTEHAAYFAVLLESTLRRGPTIRDRRELAMEGVAFGARAAAVPARMTTVSRHYFGGDASESDHDLRVDIIEVPAPCRLVPPSPVPTRASYGQALRRG